MKRLVSLAACIKVREVALFFGGLAVVITALWWWTGGKSSPANQTNSRSDLCKSLHFLPQFVMDREILAACLKVREKDLDYTERRAEFWRRWEELK